VFAPTPSSANAWLYKGGLTSELFDIVQSGYPVPGRK
jgi:hypothetical protein